MRKNQNFKISIWKWEESESLSAGLFSIWQDCEDLEWLKKNWDKFYWGYMNKTEKVQLKIKLFALANIYYEFCHQAYDMTYEILCEDITTDDFPYYHIQKLLNKHNVVLESRSTLDLKVFELIRKFKYPLFEELIHIFKSIDNLADELKAIQPGVKADYAGEDYILKWGDTFSNFW